MQARLTNLLRAMHGDREEIIDEQSESFQKFQIGQVPSLVIAQSMRVCLGF